jgi:uroporphyrinogen-III synthase
VSRQERADTPLFGRKVLVTRRSTLGSDVTVALEALGAEVVVAPTVEIVDAEDPQPLDDALSSLREGDWIAFTSAPAVDAVAARVAAGVPLDVSVRIASVGPSTTRAVEARLSPRKVELAPAAEFRGEALAASFASIDLHRRRVLLPVSDLAPAILALALTRQGAEVCRVIAYRTVMPPGAAEQLKAALVAVDAVTFASPSAVENFLAAAGERGRAIPAVVIGKSTAAAAERVGLRVVATASAPSAEGLVAAVVSHLARMP